MIRNEPPPGKSGQWCMIPPHIMAREDVTPTQKILLGCIMGNTCIDGSYCILTNNQLGSLVFLEPKSVSRALNDIKDKGLIDTVLIRDHNGMVTERRISFITFIRDIPEGYTLEIEGGVPIHGEGCPHTGGVNKVCLSSSSSTTKKAFEEIIKEKDSQNYLNLFAPHLQDSREFRRTWLKWLRYRSKERHNGIKPTTAEGQAKKLSALSEKDAIAVLMQSMDNGWTGLFDLKSGYKKYDANKTVSKELQRDYSDVPVKTFNMEG